MTRRDPLLDMSDTMGLSKATHRRPAQPLRALALAAPLSAPDGRRGAIASVPVRVEDSGGMPSRLDPMSRPFSMASALVALALALSSAACAHVAPYERGKLAHPTMTDDFEGPAASHVLAVHEGATGGGPLSESGCGCN
jgi:hypothetical protein